MRRSTMREPVLHRSENGRVDEIAGVAKDEQVADVLIEDHFGRHA